MILSAARSPGSILGDWAASVPLVHRLRSTAGRRRPGGQLLVSMTPMVLWGLTPKSATASPIPDGEGTDLGVGRWPATAETLGTRKLPDAAVWCRPPRFLASMVRWKGNAAGAGAWDFLASGADGAGRSGITVDVVSHFESWRPGSASILALGPLVPVHKEPAGP